MKVENQNTISADDAKILADALPIPVVETQYYFAFLLLKDTYEIAIKLLKTGQYIFVNLLVGQLEYAVEHIEFYRQETKAEILQEAQEIIELLSTHETRYVREVQGNRTRLALQVLQKDNWTQFAYSSTAKQ